jgi:hypothetical protein
VQGKGFAIIIIMKYFNDYRVGDSDDGRRKIWVMYDVSFALLE